MTTKAGILDAWQRRMHRLDQAEDLEFVWQTARAMLAGRIMRRGVDLDEVLTTSPATYLHAGLVYLHELAQDDEGLERERRLLEQALQDEALAWSKANVTPQPGGSEQWA